jgi:VWFA-related protein
MQNKSHAKAQRRKGMTNLSLSHKPVSLIWMALLIMLFIVPSTSAQEVADTIRVRTRVVFMDALVKDKKTGIPISDLKPENFELFDDGKPRQISYFTRDGQARKPLAIVMILDLRDDGAGRFLKREEVRKAIVEELAKLPPGDEVAILAINLNSVDDKTAVIRNGKAMWLTDFSRDPAQFDAALARIPALVAPEPEPEKPDASKHDNASPKRESSGSISVSTDPKPAAPAADAKPKESDVLETETIKGKNGAVITRTIKKDGSVNVKRESRDGKMVIQLDNIYDMAGATRDATRLVADKRPNSQAAVIWLSDGIAPIFYEDRDATEQILIRQNAIFNTLTVDMRTLYKFLLPLGQPLIGWTGLSLAGSAKRLARNSGGEAVHVSRVRDYGAGLAKIFDNLTARYSLGFALSEEEKDDGRMHELAVRVKSLDAKGKARKLEVSSRRGYYMPKSDTDQAAANK